MIDIVTLKALPTSCFRYKSEEKSTKFPNPKKKLKKTDTSCPLQVNDKNVQRIPRKLQVFINLLAHLSRKVFKFISILHKLFFFNSLLNSLVIVTNEGSIACKCFK